MYQLGKKIMIVKVLKLPFSTVVLNNRGSSISYEVKTVQVTLIHNWQQEVKEFQLKDRAKEQQIK